MTGEIEREGRRVSLAYMAWPFLRKVSNTLLPNETQPGYAHGETVEQFPGFRSQDQRAERWGEPAVCCNCDASAIPCSHHEEALYALRQDQAWLNVLERMTG